MTRCHFVSWLLAALILIPIQASAASRGLELELKSSDKPNAVPSGSIQLYQASYALVIGIDRYTNGWPALRNAVNDARAVATKLKDHGFDVTLRENLKADDFRRTLRAFFARTGRDPEARLLLWYAGHGHTVDGEGFLVPADAPRGNDPDFLVDALPLRDFGSLVRLAKSKHVLSIFDACFAGTVFEARGGVPTAAITSKTTKPVRQFITSGDAGQQVRDDGSFREYFLRALSGDEKADFNTDGYVTGEELGLFLSQRMTALTQASQTPKSGKLHDVRYNQGDFVFALERPVEVAAPVKNIDRDSLFWSSVKDSSDTADYMAYLDQYPDGVFATLAQNRLKKLAKQVASVVTFPKAKTTALTKPAAGVFSTISKPGAIFRDCPDCPEMVVIPKGTFLMGSTPAEQKWYLGKMGGDQWKLDKEKPRHRVELGYSFAVGRFEVTKWQYANFVKDTGHVDGDGCRILDGSWKKEATKNWRSVGYKQTYGGPVACVSWDDAKAYVRWLSSQTGFKYRLLSEAEWEYVARAKTTTMRYWGNDWENKKGCKYGNFADRKNWSGATFNCFDRFQYTAHEYFGLANSFGLHGVHGNVWELTEDCWNKNYNEAPTSGKAWLTGKCYARVMRGGSWISDPKNVRAATRAWHLSHHRRSDVGFRLAMTLSPNDRHTLLNEQFGYTEVVADLEREEKEARWYEYLDYGSGTLKLTGKIKDGYTISLETVGPTGHTCTLGVTGIRFNAGKASVRPTGTQFCMFSIEEQADKSLLIQGNSSCGMCGANASFHGKYKLVDKKP
jgi:formylglycine-generating enzyme required for sulfatase activity